MKVVCLKQIHLCKQQLTFELSASLFSPTHAHNNLKGKTTGVGESCLLTYFRSPPFPGVGSAVPYQLPLEVTYILYFQLKSYPLLTSFYDMLLSLGKDPKSVQEAHTET